MGEPKFLRECLVRILHQGQSQPMVLNHLLAVLSSLRAEDDDLATVLKNLRVNLLQSIQLRYTAGSPEASKVINNNGAASDEVG